MHCRAARLSPAEAAEGGADEPAEGADEAAEGD